MRLSSSWPGPRAAQLMCATIIAVAVGATAIIAQFGTFDPSFDGELWGVRHEVTPPDDGVPAGLAYSNGTLFVVDAAHKTVLAYGSTGNLLPTANHDWDAADPESPVHGFSPNQLFATTIDVDGTPRGALLLSDANSNRVAAFDTTGAHLFSMLLERPSSAPVYSPAPGEFALSVGQLALSPGAKFSFTRSTQTLTLSGVFAAAWFEQIETGAVDSGAMVFQGPMSFPVVSEEFQATPTAIKRGDEHSPAAPAPQNVFGVVFDPAGNLYVLDSITERLNVYDPALTHLFSFGTPVAGGTTAEFHEPWGLAFWPDATGTSGRLFLNDTYKSRIMVYRPFDDPDTDSVIDGLELETVIKGFVAPQPSISLFAIALDPSSGSIAVTDFADADGAYPRAVVLQQPRLAAFDVQVLDPATGGVVQSVCTGADYQIRFSLTVPAGRAAVDDVQPRLLIDGLPAEDVEAAGNYESPMQLSTGEVATYTYTLTAPDEAGADIGFLAGATASNTSDILERAEIVSIANCAGETDPSSITATPSAPAQVSGWTPVFEGETFSMTLAAQDGDGIQTVEYQLEGANESGEEPIATDFDGEDTDAVVVVTIPEAGRTTLTYRMRDGNGIWSPWQTARVRTKVLIDRTTNENAGVEFQVGDPEGMGFTYSVSGLPEGITFSTTTGQFGGVVSFDASDPYSEDPTVAAGVYSVVVTETASGGAASSVGFTWTVNHINRHPTITPIPPAAIPAIVEGEEFEIAVEGHDPDGDTAFFTFNGRSPNGHDLPPSVTIDPASGKISGTFPLDSEPSYTITVGLAECGGTPDDHPVVCADAQPGGGLATVMTITVSVTNVNQPPAVNNPGPQFSTTGQTITPLQIAASDPDLARGDVLEYIADNLPAGLSIDSASGLISGTVSNTALASYAVTVVVRDQVGALPLPSVAFEWTVADANRAPTVSSPNRSSVEHETTSLTITHEDLDGDPLTFTMTGLPVTHTINNQGVISGTFSYESAGDYVVTVTVSDGAKTASTTFNWKVLNVNRAPILNVADQNSVEGQTVTLQIDGSDPDRDPVRFSMNGLPPSFAIDPSTGVITGTFASVGEFTVNIGLVDLSTDGVGVLKTFVWRVRGANRPPIALDDTATVLRGQSVVIDVRGNDSDPDGTALTVTAVTMPSSGSAAISGGGTTVTYTASTTFSGAATFFYTVSDGTASATAKVTVTVQSGNGPPVCTAATVSPKLLWPPNHKQYYLTIAGVTDPDGGTPKIKFTSILQDESTNAGGDGNTIQDAGIEANGTKAWVRAERSGNGDGRIYLVGFTATDAQGASCSGTVTVGVPHDNGSTPILSPGRWNSITGQQLTPPAPPVVTNPGNLLNNEGDTISRQIAATDADSSALTFSASGLPPGVSINSATGLITGTLGYSAAGSYTVKVTATDGSLSDSETFTWVVKNTNRPPSAVDDAATAVQGVATIINVRGNDTDADGDTLTVVGVTTPSAGTAVIGGGGTTITYTAPATFAGTATFSYTLKDGTLTDTAKVTVTVTRKPPVANDDSATVAKNTQKILSVLSNDVVSGDSTVTIVAGPSKGTATVNANGSITYKAPSTTGSTSFTYRVTTAGGSDTAVVTVVIAGSNHDADDDNCGDRGHDHDRDSDGRDRDHRRGDHDRCRHGGSHDDDDRDCGDANHDHGRDSDNRDRDHRQGNHGRCRHSR